ncbi:S-layer homology domain-containing protein [Paenibacillus septentrionalis]|uniref:S-layer homology domain-containing protein n=1 Tax=Paenibacillus septentrionalis TaxID=429342 RepID=A0ABW1V1B8_9BACL
MPKKKLLKKIMTGAVAFTLVGGAALPVLSQQVPVIYAAEKGITPFTDVPAGLYAEKHIYRLSLQQIVRGYENKATGEFTFRYNNTISQEEAVIMAIRFAGLESKLDTTGLYIFQEGFVVKEDYKPYIALAFEEGLLDREEEYANAAAEPEVEWGSKPAAREWVTKLVIRAIGEQEKADELASVSSSFADKDQIDSKYTGYVNAAVELGLVKGVTETTFAPQTAINRASFSTILSRAQKEFPIEAQGQHYGVITNLTETTITVYEQGRETVYELDSTTGFYSNDSDFAVKKDQFKLYTDVALIEVNGVAKFVETQSSTPKTNELIAPVGRVNTAGNIIYVWIDNNPVAIPYDETAVIKDSAGNKLTVGDLKENSKIRIIRDEFRETPKVISIELITEGEEATTTVTGTYVSYVQSNNMITIKTNNGLVSKFLAKTPTITIPNVKHATLDNLIANADTVVLTMNAKDEVINVSIPSADYKTMYLPTIVSHNGVNGLITVLDASGLHAEALFITDATRYLLDGVIVDLKHLSSDPIKWQNIMIRYVETGNQKQVVYFDMISEINGIVKDVNYFDEIIELQLPDGTVKELKYKGATIESLTKKDLTYMDLKEGTMVTADLSSQDGSVMKFRLNEVYQMSVSSVSTLTKQVNFKHNNVTYSVLFDEAEFVDASGKQVAFSDIKTNNSVIVNFTGQRIVRVIVQ